MTPFLGGWYTSRTIRKHVILAVAAALAVGACSAAPPAPSARRGGDLVVALGQDAQSLNPLVAGDVWSVRAYTPLFPQLYEAGPDLAVSPSLAAAFPAISADGLTWTVRLRPARWSDGRAITADDVVYTVQTEMDPSLDTRATFDWSPLRSVERVDAMTVRFQLGRPDGAFLGDRLLAPIVPKHALQGVALASMPGALFSTQPLVTGGPFRLRLRSPGSSLSLFADQRYFGARPHLDTVTMLVLADSSQLEAEIAQGNVAWAPDIPASVAAQLRGVTGVKVRSFPQLGRFSLVFNTRPGRPFAPAELRRFVQHNLDTGAVASAAGGQPAAGDVYGSSWGYSPPRAVTGAPIAVPATSADLLIPAGDSSRSAAAAEVERQLGRFGIHLTTVPASPSEFQRRLQAGDFDAALAGLGERVDPDPEADVASWETPAQDPHGHNFAGLADAQLDALLKQDLALAPTDHAARRPLLARIEAQIAADCPLIDLWTIPEWDAFGPGLANPGPVGPQLDQGLQSSFYARWSLVG